MNLQNAIKLREQLLSLPGKFNYNSYMFTYDQEGEKTGDVEEIVHNKCGTSACVAGWCALLNNPEAEDMPYPSYCSRWSAEYLELTLAERMFLFYPWEYSGIKLGYVQPSGYRDTLSYDISDAIDRLNHLISMRTSKES
jgi:hypothetical protein